MMVFNKQHLQEKDAEKENSGEPQTFGPGGQIKNIFICFLRKKFK